MSDARRPSTTHTDRARTFFSPGVAALAGDGCALDVCKGGVGCEARVCQVARRARAARAPHQRHPHLCHPHLCHPHLSRTFFSALAGDGCDIVFVCFWGREEERGARRRRRVWGRRACEESEKGPRDACVRVAIGWWLWAERRCGSICEL